MQLFFDAEQLLRFFFLDRGDGHAGPPRDDIFDVLAVDHSRGRFVEMIFLAQGAQVLALLTFFVGVKTCLLELVIRDGVFHAMHDELDALLDFGQLFRQRSLAQLHARSGFVDEVDCLVRQEAVRNVAVGMRDREVDGFVGVSDRVEFLVTVLDAEQDLDCVDFVRRRNFDCLEAALERAIFFDRLAVFARRCRADALNLAAR